ncbi:MAG: phosphoribosyltransferase family protein [Patescibacteria group bacterium]|jgi:orotate phosphoribosyltransferase
MRDIFDILKEANAILKGHFVFTNGQHSDTYLNKDGLYPYAELTSEVGMMMAEKTKDLDIDTVVGPALGAIILSQWTAYHLSKLKGKVIYGVYTEKMPDKSQRFTRGYDKFVKGKKVLVVEDWTTTGLSALKTVKAIQEAGGDVVAVCSMVNRNPDEVTDEFFGTKYLPLKAIKIQACNEDECHMCKQGVPISTEVGHGKEYLERKGIKQ